MQTLLSEAGGVALAAATFAARNLNAYAERFVRSIRQECLRHTVPLAEARLRWQVHKELDLERRHSAGALDERAEDGLRRHRSRMSPAAPHAPRVRTGHRSPSACLGCRRRPRQTPSIQATTLRRCLTAARGAPPLHSQTLQARSTLKTVVCGGVVEPVIEHPQFRVKSPPPAHGAQRFGHRTRTSEPRSGQRTIARRAESASRRRWVSSLDSNRSENEKRWRSFSVALPSPHPMPTLNSQL